MKLYSYKGLKPQFADDYYVSDGVQIIGDVVIGKNVNIWFNSVVRGDVNKISIGDNTNVQDLCMLHVTEKDDLIIGEDVSIGHAAILHGCTIGKGCLIGMGAKVLDGVVIGDNCLVAAGSIVPPNKTYPAGSMIMGAPAKVVKQLSEVEIDNIANHYKSYIGYSKDFKDPQVLEELF
jgi:gamma-carbonic anhydrase